jgi:pimeloyl-ACP methyl ester carboxylesterase
LAWHNAPDKIQRMTQTEIPLQHITINNIDIAHAVTGEGPPVLLLHGWGANVELLLSLAEKLLRRGYRVYAPDLPGFGQSNAPPQPWSVFDYADFVRAYMDANNLQKVYLFGHSFGGRLALILGADSPERIHKIALSNSAGVRPKTPFLPKIRLRVYKTIRNSLETMGLQTIADTLRQSYNDRYGSSDFQQVSGVMRETFVKVVNEDLLPYAARIEPPVLLFWGDADSDTPLWQGKLLEKTIPDAGLVLYEGAGHYTYLERAADVARVMDFFFSESDSGNRQK